MEENAHKRCNEEKKLKYIGASGIKISNKDYEDIYVAAAITANCRAVYKVNTEHNDVFVLINGDKVNFTASPR